MRSTIRVWKSAFSIQLFLCVSTLAYSQESDESSTASLANDKIRVALSRIDSESAEERLAGQSTLKLGLNSPEDKQRSIIGLVLLQIRDNNIDAIERFLEKRDRWLDSSDSATQCFVLRIQLWRDIYREDAAATDLHFRDLVRLSVRPELADSVQRANGSFLGNLLGGYPCLSKKPLLADEVVEKARQALDNRTTRAFHGAFEMAHTQSAKMATQLSDWESLHAEDSLEQKINVVKASLAGCQASQKELQSQIAVSAAELRSQQAILDRLESAERSLRKEMDRLTRYWESNPQIHNPVEPLEAVISQQVPKREQKKTGTRQIKKTRDVRDPKAVGGTRREEYWEREDVYEWVSRPIQDVERDIARIYVPLKNQYDSWMQLRSQTIDKQAEVQKELDQCEAEQLVAKDAVKNATRYRNELRETETELDQQERREKLLIASLESQGALSPMHPSLVPLHRISEEKAILLNPPSAKVSR